MEYGYRSVTLDMVADRAGVTKAAVYYHFRDKAALVVATAHHVFDRARQGTAARLAGAGSLRERLTAIAEVVLARPQPFTAYDTLLHEAMLELSAEALSEMRQARSRVTTLIEDAFTDATRRGEITAADPLLAAHCFLAMLQVGQSRAVDGQLQFRDARRTAHILVDTLWAGIGRPSS